MTPHALEDVLENSVIVVESMILGCFIHSSVPWHRLSGGKQILIGGIQIAIDLFKELF